MNKLDRGTARALVDAGYMPLNEYLKMFSDRSKQNQVCSPSIVPDVEGHLIEDGPSQQVDRAYI
jgi:hypothetical protein